MYAKIYHCHAISEGSKHDKRKSTQQCTARQDLIDIILLAVLDAASSVPLHPLGGVSWVAVRHHLLEEVQRCSLAPVATLCCCRVLDLTQSCPQLILVVPSYKFVDRGCHAHRVPFMVAVPLIQAIQAD